MPTKVVLEEMGRHFDPLEEGTDATVRHAVSPEVGDLTGRYFDRQTEARANEQA